MSPSPPYLPTTERVAVAWLSAALSGPSVGLELPGDPSTWLDEGFVQVQALPGGSADVDTPERRRPVVQVDLWAAGGSSSISPRWNLAGQLAEALRVATETQNYGATVALPGDYDDARVQAVYFLTEPRRIPDDPSGYARMTVDLALDWVRA